MPDWDDYHAFINTSSDDTGSGASNVGGAGCSGTVITWIVVILAVLWFIGELFG